MSRNRKYGVSNDQLSRWDEREARWAEIQRERKQLAPLWIAAQMKPKPPPAKGTKAQRKAAKRARKLARRAKRMRRVAAIITHKLLNNEWERAAQRDG